MQAAMVDSGDLFILENKNGECGCQLDNLAFESCLGQKP